VYTEALLDSNGSLEDGGRGGGLVLVEAGKSGASSPPNARGGDGSGGSAPAASGGRSADGDGGDAGDASPTAGTGDGGTAPSGAGGSSGGSSSPSGGSSGAGGTQPQLPAGVDLLDDMEDGNFYISPAPPRYGYWYLAGDTTVGAVLPRIEDLMGSPAPSRQGSTLAVHYTASGFKGWGSSLGLSFTDAASKRVTYDAGNAVGISFWVRGSVDKAAKLRVQIPLLGTDPTGTQCGGAQQGQCLDHFAILIAVTDEWQQVKIPFSSLHQGGWGAPLAGFNPGEILGIEWSAGTSSLDIWLDDLALMRPE
jgi:hypothetical protein